MEKAVTYHLNGKSAGIEEDEIFIVAGFSDSTTEPIRYVTLQRAREFDIQDKNLGMDGVYIEVDDQCRCAYKGIIDVELNNSKLILYLTPDAQDKLNIRDKIKIEIDLGDEVTSSAVRTIA